jgi:hypothetical protein
VIVQAAGWRQVFRRAYAGSLTVRGSSVVAGMNDDVDAFLRVFVDRGRRCQGPTVRLPEVDHAWHALYGFWIGSHGLEWVMGYQTVFDQPIARYTDLAVMAVHLDGRCSPTATRWHIPTRPLPSVSTVAIDGAYLYYATTRGLYRRRLPDRESDAPPANDDFTAASPMTSDLPLDAHGVAGYAAREPLCERLHRRSRDLEAHAGDRRRCRL